MERELLRQTLARQGVEEMEEILLHSITAALTVAAWTVLSGDLGQAAGVTILYWMIFWAVAEAAERRKDGKNAPAGRPSCKGKEKIKNKIIIKRKGEKINEKKISITQHKHPYK